MKFCKSLKRTLAGIKIPCSLQKAGKMCMLKISSNIAVYNFGKWMYEKSSIYMNRKYEKFEEIKKFKIGTSRYA